MNVSSRFFVWCLMVACPVAADAALTMPTRVVFDAAQNETTVVVRYSARSGAPVLMQAWLDDGSTDARTDSKQSVSFILTPAVARIDAGQSQTIRILPTRHELAADRESVFYFNVMEVPPTPAEDANAQANFMQFAAHTRVKFFYRPRGLKTAPEAAAQSLRFVLDGVADGAVRVRVANPSPYHVTLRDLSLHAGGVPQEVAGKTVVDTAKLAERDVGDRAPMVAPFSELAVALPLMDAAGLPASVHVRFAAMNDYGGASVQYQALER